MKTMLGVALLTFAIGAGAQEPQFALVQPDASPLRPLRVSRNHELVADFNGRIEVTGTLVAEWAGGIESEYSEPDVALVPDAASIARLPHFAGYEVRHIELRNGRHALFLAIGADKANALLDRKSVRVEAKGAFVLTDYSVGVECDASWARATVVSARIPDRVAANVEPIETC
jgi:hypothetical protein